MQNNISKWNIAYAESTHIEIKTIVIRKDMAPVRKASSKIVTPKKSRRNKYKCGKAKKPVTLNEPQLIGEEAAANNGNGRRKQLVKSSKKSASPQEEQVGDGGNGNGRRKDLVKASKKSSPTATITLGNQHVGSSGSKSSSPSLSHDR